MLDAAKEYMDRALLAPKVIAYVREGFFAGPPYLMVGVATCRKVIRGDTVTREKKVSLKADVGITGSGVDSGVGLSGGKVVSTGSQLEIQEECDISYRVRKFQYSGLRKWARKSRDVTEGPMFGKGTASRTVLLTSAEIEEVFEEVPVVEYFESDDEDYEPAGG